MPVAAHRSWPELVFHVLAHVEVTAHLPSSLFDPVYVRWVEETLGPASSRTLGEDVGVIGLALGDHEALARVQLLAWLFDDAEAARAVSAREIAELSEDEVTRGEVLRALKKTGPAAELLRCAALLEDGHSDELPRPSLPKKELEVALDEVARAAPRLPHQRVVPLRSLRLRGRVRELDVFVGWPCAELDLAVDHVAWQAAHEATVAEIGAHTLEAPHISERGLEAVALVTLAQRAGEAGLSEGHGAWLSHLAGDPGTSVDDLSEAGRALYEAVRNRE